jgi:hypothetical protein
MQFPMKNLSLITAIFSLIYLTSCDPTNTKYMGPITDPRPGDEDGYWKLTSFHKKGSVTNLANADSLALLQVSIYLQYDSAYYTNNYHYVFQFFSPDLKKTVTLDAIPWGDRTNPEKTRDTFWYRVSQKRGFQAFFYVAKGTGRSYQMDISNVMDGTEYKAELDTLRYVYTPTEKF